jgi:phage baseplate assembly protein W
MAIKIKQLEQVAKNYTEKGYIYKDLSLDVKLNNLLTPGYNLPVPGSDLKADFDLAAIVNSLINLFNTLPGQRFLFPEYGLDLYQFLFLPITESTGNAISERILRGIERFEPRIRVLRVNVIPNIDEQTYFITLIIQLPIFKQTTTLTGALNTRTQSFIFLPTTRNK